uniref:Uncharacterized protein n=1 Tax=Candidatus Kentrum sp. FM TaxID=2126340 RepID=A0A450S1X9_9GAMM|nr:MAG: hypothetical protein BECKFM1743A_GA0114220_100288 [Candidatus Kentron sp. FM]VFJ46662.1 MAG: hypothetical protein BECKFM1743C_GA0114222_100388 [Candidatus Kentron sp. FM]VFK06843.1 MAG: hypothetical protein BECKFM1743B_GA0114221_100267 [Candidatus Kentron sp. FM]
MKTIVANEAKNRLGPLLQPIQPEPAPMTYETFSPYERQRRQAGKRALDLLSRPPAGEWAALSEDEVLEMVNREIAHYRADG